MITNYLIYLMSLPKEERIKQILIMLAFFLLLLSICGLLKLLKTKFLDENKNSLFQKFLKKLWFYINVINKTYFRIIL